MSSEKAYENLELESQETILSSVEFTPGELLSFPVESFEDKLLLALAPKFMSRKNNTLSDMDNLFEVVSMIMEERELHAKTSD
jgi:hypothetical protein